MNVKIQDFHGIYFEKHFPKLSSGLSYWFSIVATDKCHKHSGLKLHKLIFLQFRRSEVHKPRFRAVFLLEAPAENQFSSLSWFLEATWLLGLLSPLFF